jgi:hypothetical protein
MPTESSNEKKRRSERLRRRKNTLFRKANALGKNDDIVVFVAIHYKGQFQTYKSIQKVPWPSWDDIVCIEFLILITSLN